MSQDLNPVNIIVGVAVSVIVAFLAVFVVNAVATSGMAPSPGDPFWPAWNSLIDGFGTAIVLVGGGILVALAFVVAVLKDAF